MGSPLGFLCESVWSGEPRKLWGTKTQTGSSYCSFLPPQSGKKQLPDAEFLSRRFLLRRKFIPDPQGTNLMFAFFAQHFTHQFFKTSGKMGPGFTKALGHGVST